MKVLHPAGWQPPVGYANGIAATGTVVFVAGQVGWNSQQQFESVDIAPQFDQAALLYEKVRPESRKRRR